MTIDKVPLRERRLQQARKQLAHALDRREAAFYQLVKVDTKVRWLRKQVARLERPAPAKAAPVEPTPAREQIETGRNPIVSSPPERTGNELADELPGFLRRQPGEGDRLDAEARAAIEAGQAERKRARANAKRDPNRRRMPLTGKAAEAVIAAAWRR